MNVYIPRIIEESIKVSVKKTPVIALTGPRQSGKTTLAKHLFPDYLYANLEFPDTRQFAEQDPRGFLNQSKTMIIDEIQRIPELFSYIQGLVDEDNHRKYILTGSHNLSLQKNIAQSLAGRVTLFTLLPFSIEELRLAKLPLDDLLKKIFDGWYPRVVANGSDPREWYQSYIQTYLERDVRDMSAIHMMERFYTFLRVLALRAGSILNYAQIAKEVGTAPNTIRDWISVLESSYIVYRLKPYHANIKKRLVKSPKIYFYDTGLLCSLLGLTDPQELPSYPHFGFLFENFIVSEFIKRQSTGNVKQDVYFYRDQNGNEVDLILAANDTLHLYEIKSSKAIPHDAVRGLIFFHEQVHPAASQNIIYGADTSQTVETRRMISWRDCGNLRINSHE